MTDTHIHLDIPADEPYRQFVEMLDGGRLIVTASFSDKVLVHNVPPATRCVIEYDPHRLVRGEYVQWLSALEV